MAETLYHFGGLDALTGKPLIAPQTFAGLLDWVRRDQNPNLPEVKEKQRIWQALERERQESGRARLGLMPDVHPEDVKSAGWAVLYHPDVPAGVRKALEPLVKRRAGKVLDDYQPGKNFLTFLAKYHAQSGMVDPKKLPYYLLLVGSPEQIPFEFQYELDGDYAVGRLYFDTVEDYERYVSHVAKYEDSAQAARPPQVTIFAPQHPSKDAPTENSAQYLATPLHQELSPRYQVELLKGTAAQRTALLDRLGGQTSFLFTCTHGLGMPSGHADQIARQGAIVTSEFPGEGGVTPQMCVSGNDLGGIACSGLVVFAFGCYTAGTPQMSETEQNLPRAPQPFLSNLPKRLLSAGALGFVGHVDIGFDLAFLDRDDTGQYYAETTHFQSVLIEAMSGLPLGHAMRAIGDRYLFKSRVLTNKLAEWAKGYKGADSEALRVWLDRNDARNYILIGDPFVTLRK